MSATNVMPYFKHLGVRVLGTSLDFYSRQWTILGILLAFWFKAFRCFVNRDQTCSEVHPNHYFSLFVSQAHLFRQRLSFPNLSYSSYSTYLSYCHFLSHEPGVCYDLYVQNIRNIRHWLLTSVPCHLLTKTSESVKTVKYIFSVLPYIMNKVSASTWYQSCPTVQTFIFEHV